MDIFALRGRPLRLFSVLSGGAGVVLLLSAAAPSSAADAPARTPTVTGGRATTSGGTWGPAKEVAAALNTGGGAAINSVSCASAGNCSAGGYYTDSSGNQQAFVINEANGAWGKATEVAAALNTLGVAAINSVSCASAGNCSAGGYYSVSSGNQQAFVINETNGAWGKAMEVAAALNRGRSARIESVSCGSAGNCSAGGHYRPGIHSQQAFVVNETSGAWGKATEVAAALNTGGSAAISSVSCGSAGNCSAGGHYRDGSTHSQQAFVVNETSGAWGKATEVAAALNTLGVAAIDSVSCGSAGNCSAGGLYVDSFDHAQAFVVNETSGTWGKAMEVAAALDTGGGARIDSVSCAVAGNCSAGGDYGPSVGQQAFVVNETSGTWGKATEVAAALDTGAFAEASSVSCGSAGNCSASGFYTDSSRGTQAFVINETNGAWGKATEVAAALNTGGNAWTYSVSCAAAGACSAGGFYTDSSGHGQAFVVSKP